MDLRAKKCCPFVLKAQLKLRDRPSQERKKKEQFGTFQFGTSAMVPSNFEGLVGYRTLRDEGQALLKAYDCVFGRDFQACVCIAHMACPCHPYIESTDSVIANTDLGAGYYLHTYNGPDYEVKRHKH